MEILSQDQIKQIIEEIDSPPEVDRRAGFQRRQEIYNDGGKRFLLEQLTREFKADSIKEMRIAPINLLKVIVDKRANLYKQPPIRTCMNAKDQALLDYYTTELELNERMEKAHRYFTLHSNTTIYTVPNLQAGTIKVHIIPPYLYSAAPNQIDKTKPDVFVFSAFSQEGRITILDDVPSATGVQGFDRQKGLQQPGTKLASEQHDSEAKARRLIWWTDKEHFTTNGEGEKILNPEMGPDQILNPIEQMSVINLAKDRDNEFWSKQFEDTVDLTMALMLGWSDLLSIAKMQGWSQLVISSMEEPKQLTIGLNKVVWLKMAPDPSVPAPKMEYISPSSPLDQYKGLLMELLALLLTTARLNPRSVGGSNTSSSYTSGFHALIENADILEARKADMSPLRSAEQDTWRVIAAWHNYMFDTGVLEQEARSLGKFSEEFEVQVQYAEVKPLESEQDKLAEIEKKRALGLITRAESLKRLYPDMTDEQIKAKIQEIDGERAAAAKTVMNQMMEGGSNGVQEEAEETEDEEALNGEEG